MPTAKYPETAANTLAGRLAVWVASGLGVGFVTPAPGTVGGLWGLFLVPAIAGLPAPEVQLGVLVVLVVAAAAVCDLAARALADEVDPQVIVLDEIVVLPIVFLGIGPIGWAVLAAGFLLFRLFDIWKPGPVRLAERLPGGWGIVADDCVAAAMAWVALQAVVWGGRAAGLHMWNAG